MPSTSPDKTVSKIDSVGGKWARETPALIVENTITGEVQKYDSCLFFMAHCLHILHTW